MTAPTLLLPRQQCAAGESCIGAGWIPIDKTARTGVWEGWGLGALRSVPLICLHKGLQLLAPTGY